MNKETFKVIHFFLGAGLMTAYLITMIEVLFGLGLMFCLWFIVDTATEKLKKKSGNEYKPLSE